MPCQSSLPEDFEPLSLADLCVHGWRYRLRTSKARVFFGAES